MTADLVAHFYSNGNMIHISRSADPGHLPPPIRVAILGYKTINMETSIQHAFQPAYNAPAINMSPWKKFIGWADRQEEHRFGWTAVSIAGHGCVFTIITVATILFTGNNFIFWPFAIAAMTIPLVANLAAMPTKVTIPLLFGSVLVDAAIIVTCLVMII